MAFRKLPAAPENEDVRTAVIVVVALDHVQAAHEASKASVDCSIDEPAVAVIYEVVHGAAWRPVRNHQVEIAIAIEILGDRPARQVFNVQPHRGGNVRKFFDI